VVNEHSRVNKYNVKMLENRSTNLLRLNMMNTPIVNKVTWVKVWKRNTMY